MFDIIARDNTFITGCIIIIEIKIESIHMSSLKLRAVNYTIKNKLVSGHLNCEQNLPFW